VLLATCRNKDFVIKFRKQASILGSWLYGNSGRYKIYRSEKLYFEEGAGDKLERGELVSDGQYQVAQIKYVADDKPRGTIRFKWDGMQLVSQFKNAEEADWGAEIAGRR